MNIAMIYAIAAILAFVLGAPLALLAPVLLPALVSLPAEELALLAPTATVATAPRATTGAPFVRVYAARGPVARRPAVHPWTLCQTAPVAHPLDKAGRPLRGAAKRASIAKASRKACVSHACVSHTCVTVVR